MNILFLSAIADSLIPELQERLSPEQNRKIQFFNELTIAPAEADLIFIDYSLCEFKEFFYDILKFKNKVAILIPEDDYGKINNIFYTTGVNHLFSIAENEEQLNFIDDMKDFILNWGTHPSLDNLMPNPEYVTSSSIVSSNDIEAGVKHLLAGHDFSESFDGLPAIINNILDEALSNAIFRAPIDSSGEYLYRNRRRTDDIVMIPGKEVEAKLLSNKDKIVISVKDLYGTLTENNLFDYPPDTGEERRAGMRLGMYLMFRYGHKYIINVVRNKFTENIIIIEKSRRFKNYDLREKSFHFSIEDDGNSNES